jgi:plastocyanin
VVRGIALIAALGALLVVPGSASAATLGVSIGSQNAFNPASLTVSYGNTVIWTNNSSRHHTSTADLFNLWDEDLPTSDPTSDSILFPRAGAYAYHCEIHTSMHGTIRVTMSAASISLTLGQHTQINFATQSAPAGFTEEIQKRRNSGNWKVWQSSTGTSVAFTPAKTGTFRFRARLHRTSPAASTGWSPILTITVSN